MTYISYNNHILAAGNVKKQVENLLLEYIIALAVEWHIENEKIKNPTFHFNGSTRAINANTFLFYPFYFTTANGHSKALFNSSGLYKRSFLGPISETLAKKTEFNEKLGVFECVLTYFTITTSRITLNDGIVDVMEIKSAIENTFIEGLPIRFKDLEVEKDDETKHTKLIDAINKSKDALKIQSNNKFLNYDVEHFRNFGQGYYNSTIGEVITYENAKKDRIFNPIN